jgi:hypothetical protein
MTSTSGVVLISAIGAECGAAPPPSPLNAMACSVRVQAAFFAWAR